MGLPKIIQGGMGVGVSNWRLAQAVSAAGQLGVVSGTALDNVLARRLQLGDPGGHMRRAMARFPSPRIAQRVLDRYFIPGGKTAAQAFAPVDLYTATPSQELLALTVLANFAEVLLAKEGHAGPVGVNYLEKIQLPLLPSLYGAMLAGVDYVLMGAGIPREIPGILDALVAPAEVSLKLHVDGAPADTDWRLRFDTRGFVDRDPGLLKRPMFVPIIASGTLALALARKANGRIDGFVVEGPRAGGHNAPARGPLQLNGRGEPVYGPRDEVDLESIRKLGLPFWVAGCCAAPEKLRAVLEAGAEGIQVGTAFALCRESGLDEGIKQELYQRVRQGDADVFTDPLASPTGFPFKVACLAGTLSEEGVYADRPRVCNLGYLRSAYLKPDGALGYRCAAEPVLAFLAKGGTLEETQGRKCLCNGLLADIGFPQQRPGGYTEKPLVTSGDDIDVIRRFLDGGTSSYSAAEVIAYLLTAAEGPEAPAPAPTNGDTVALATR